MCVMSSSSLEAIASRLEAIALISSSLSIHVDLGGVDHVDGQGDICSKNTQCVYIYIYTYIHTYILAVETSWLELQLILR